MEVVSMFWHLLEILVTVQDFLNSIPGSCLSLLFHSQWLLALWLWVFRLNDPVCYLNSRRFCQHLWFMLWYCILPCWPVLSYSVLCEACLTFSGQILEWWPEFSTQPDCVVGAIFNNRIHVFLMNVVNAKTTLCLSFLIRILEETKCHILQYIYTRKLAYIPSAPMFFCRKNLLMTCHLLRFCA